MFRINIAIMAGISMTLMLCGCGKAGKRGIPALDRDLAWGLTVEAAKMVPRHSGTPGAARQAEFIAAKARSFGARVEVDEFEALTPVGRMRFRNVIAHVPGRSSRYLIVACHYDAKLLPSEPEFQAANDGASGVGMLLAMISAVMRSGEPPPYSLRFVFFAGEECIYDYTENDGLFGSKHYSAKLEGSGELKNCRAMLLADMVGDKDLGITLPADTPRALADLCFAAARELGLEIFFGFYPWNIIDDHVPFQQKGIPAINLIDFHFGQDNRYWHTGADNLDNISADSIKIVGDVMLRMIYTIK